MVGLAPGKDPGVGTLEDGGQAPQDVAEGLVLRPDQIFVWCLVLGIVPPLDWDTMLLYSVIQN